MCQQRQERLWVSGRVLIQAKLFIVKMAEVWRTPLAKVWYTPRWKSSEKVVPYPDLRGDAVL